MAPNHSGVNLNAEEKKKWAELSQLPYRVARYPCPITIRRLGIEQCFNELREEGQLNGLFMAQRNPSYQRLTLEFLSTLEVIMNRREIVAIKFRMRNAEYTVTMAQFKEIFGFSGEVYREPFNFSHNANDFWKAITTVDDNFAANRAKGSLIRNPALRLLQKACVCYPFARHEHGSVQRDELFLLWTILHKEAPLNLGHFMIKHLERASKKKTGTLCVGAVVSAIALHLGVSTRGLVADIGDNLMDFGFLRRTRLVGVDQRGQIYLIQRAADHYPLPDTVNTYVNGPFHKENWKMKAAVHEQVTAVNPRNLQFRDVSPSSSVDEAPHMGFPEIEMGDEQNEEENEEEGEDQPTYQGGDEAGTSTQRTRSRQERQEEDYGSINERLTRMELRQQEYWVQNEARWDQFETNWTQFTDFNNAQWANINARFDEFRGQWQHPPPPPQ
ncbi:uncharacterized protein LOC121772440 [Salvia splendens]|uniref:uncharacterized protein LOC121772440 n=1 Tax=Salvia splendens TaxID=180675 RepID=UPI001C2609AB|nr:uncharacterized protein LOC121772440 [Salvia splendens]XP_042025488.1 uncharacterized protein LOC121772440 [Salvia splendens]